MLEYADLGSRLTTRVTNEQNAKLSQRGRKGVTWPNFSVVTQTEASVGFPLATLWRNRYDVITLDVIGKYMLNHTENSKYYCKKNLAVYNAF